MLQFLAPLIGAGLQFGLGKLFNRKSNLQKGMENKILPGLDNLIWWSGEDREARHGMMRRALPAFDDSLSYYRGLMSPSSTQQIDALLGPSRTAVADQTQNVIQNLGMFGPRGGGTNAMTGQAMFNQNRQLMEMIPQARANAAQQLTGLGQILGNLGLNFGQLSAQEQEGVLSAITGLLGGQQQQRAVNQQAGGQLGQQLGALLGPWILKGLGGLFGGGNSSPITGAGDAWPTT